MKKNTDIYKKQLKRTMEASCDKRLLIRIVINYWRSNLNNFSSQACIMLIDWTTDSIHKQNEGRSEILCV